MAKVLENQTLSQIAKESGFNEQTLIKANPKLFESPVLNAFPNTFSPEVMNALKKMSSQSLMDPDTLLPGVEINIPKKKKKRIEQSSGTAIKYTVQKSPKKFLNITLANSNDNIESVELFINNKSIPIVPIEESKRPPLLIVRSTDPLPENLPVIKEKENNVNKLVLNFKKNNSDEEANNDKNQKEEIFINVGGLDPIQDPSINWPEETDSEVAKKAVQKLLRNIGFYFGEIDGDIEKIESKEAVGNFQTSVMGMKTNDINFQIPNLTTCVELCKKQGLGHMGAIQPLKGKNQKSPGGGKPAQEIPKPTIELVRNGFSITRSIGFGRFDNAFEFTDPSKDIRFDVPTLKEDFVSGDSGSFRIKIVDKGAKKFLATAKWFITDKNGNRISNLFKDEDVILKLQPPDTYFSDPLMLVHETFDLEPTNKISVGNFNYPIRLAGMFDKLNVEYTNGPNKTTISSNVIQPSEHRPLGVHLFLLLDQKDAGKKEDLIQTFVNFFGEAQDVYETVGVFFSSHPYRNNRVNCEVKEKVRKAVIPSDPSSSIKYSVNIIDENSFNSTEDKNTFRSINLDKVGLEELKKLSSIITPISQIRIFFVRGLSGNLAGAGLAGGVTITKSLINDSEVKKKINFDNNAEGCIGLSSVFIQPYRIPHEIGHFFMDKALKFPKDKDINDTNVSGHYFSDKSNFPNQTNLMFAGKGNFNIRNALTRKRIWNVNDISGFNWGESLINKLNSST